MPQPLELLQKIDSLLEEMIAQQRAKVLALGRSLVSNLTAEDVLNPDGYPELRDDGAFNYADGQLAGLLSAQMALRARIASPLREESEGLPPAEEFRR